MTNFSDVFIKNDTILGLEVMVIGELEIFLLFFVKKHRVGIL